MTILKEFPKVYIYGWVPHLDSMMFFEEDTDDLFAIWGLKDFKRPGLVRFSFCSGDGTNAMVYKFHRKFNTTTDFPIPYLEEVSTSSGQDSRGHGKNYN